MIFVQYPSLYNSDAPYAIPTVKIEISVLSMAEPYEMKRISSLIEQVYKDENVDSDIVQTIKTVSPRTHGLDGLNNIRINIFIFINLFNQ